MARLKNPALRRLPLANRSPNTPTRQRDESPGGSGRVSLPPFSPTQSLSPIQSPLNNSASTLVLGESPRGHYQSTPIARKAAQNSQEAAHNTNGEPAIVEGGEGEEEIHRVQESPDLILLKASFFRLVRKVAATLTDGEELRFQATAIAAVQEGAEAYLTKLLKDGAMVAKIAGRERVEGRDIHMVRQIRGELSIAGRALPKDLDLIRRIRDE